MTKKQDFDKIVFEAMVPIFIKSAANENPDNTYVRPFRKMRTRLFSLLVLSVALFIDCDVDSTDYVPDEELVENKFQEFLAGSMEIKGIYGNNDVDSVIFKYTSNNDNVLKTVERQAT